MPLVLAVGAVALIGILVGKAVEDARAQRQFRAANGWSLDEVAAQLTADFDRDGDGRIAWDVVKGARLVGEAVRTTSYTWSEPLVGFSIPTGTLAVKERRRTYSIEPLVRIADANGDGVATRAEIVAVLRVYDPDGNGRITAAERERALSDFGETLAESTTRTVGVLPPPAARTNQSGSTTAPATPGSNSSGSTAPKVPGSN